MFILIKIPVSGHLEYIPFPEGIREQLDQMYETIGCDTIEIVRLPDDNCLVVDDCGAINGSPYNAKASALYGGAIFGTALLGKIKHADDGDIVTGSNALYGGAIFGVTGAYVDVPEGLT